MPILQASTDTAACSTDGYTVNINNEIVKYQRTIQRTDAFSCHLMGGHYIDTSGTLFRKTHFNDVNGYDEKLFLCEDGDLGIRLSQAYRVHHIPKPLYRHRSYNHCVSRTIDRERVFSATKYFLEKHAHACQQEPLRKVLTLEWARVYGDRGKDYLSQNERKKARECFLQSLRYNPFSRKTLLRYLRSFVPFTSKHIRRPLDS